MLLLTIFILMMLRLTGWISRTALHTDLFLLTKKEWINTIIIYQDSSIHFVLELNSLFLKFRLLNWKTEHFLVWKIYKARFHRIQNSQIQSVIWRLVVSKHKCAISTRIRIFVIGGAFLFTFANLYSLIQVIIIIGKNEMQFNYRSFRKYYGQIGY